MEALQHAIARRHLAPLRPSTGGEGGRGITHDHGPAAGGCQLGAGQGEPCRGFALVLFTLGIYGLLANSVAGRMREMGIRMALGSTGRASGGDRHRAWGDLGYQRGDGWLGAGIVIRAPV